ncbi:hypothetical protein [Nocardia farcinica]|uniref:Uncharacterized protein n=2 Tax=Nocardia farcinica TaxID=37329 RepID=Q5YUL0_NOCFA|nr:hypothetical protein [Nocardia farcinica]AXK89248.1 hypothetical protein DXT66_00485 [Nocardia farcinica]MBA4856263.1 hypothetical protein [Nocardia farcinica]MBC9814084.1 hypothetical protein [Nocardia farcinica]PFX03468.1 hypothetical protein CJ469_01342 [Nocardia farcinica]PFX08618.1 hypothetical protein CJ468_02359 [Nocardia farcinica]
MPECTRYQFIIDGGLSERARAAFPELTATVAPHKTATTLFGPVPDSTAMRGILARIDDLGLTLLEMRRLPD